jgi:hypothetical protein
MSVPATGWSARRPATSALSACPNGCGIAPQTLTIRRSRARSLPSCTGTSIAPRCSPYLLTCEALSTTQEKFAFTVFERTFKEFCTRDHRVCIVGLRS